MSKSAGPLRILVLGGTSFIGPHQVRYAVERGHTVTLFNRGRTNPQLFPELEKLRGDRDGDLEARVGEDRSSQAVAEPRDETVAHRESAHEAREHQRGGPDAVPENEPSLAKPDHLEDQRRDAGEEEERAEQSSRQPGLLEQPQDPMDSLGESAVVFARGGPG